MKIHMKMLPVWAGFFLLQACCPDTTQTFQYEITRLNTFNFNSLTPDTLAAEASVLAEAYAILLNTEAEGLENLSATTFEPEEPRGLFISPDCGGNPNPELVRSELVALEVYADDEILGLPAGNLLNDLFSSVLRDPISNYRNEKEGVQPLFFDQWFSDYHFYVDFAENENFRWILLRFQGPLAEEVTTRFTVELQFADGRTVTSQTPLVTLTVP